MNTLNCYTPDLNKEERWQEVPAALMAININKYAKYFSIQQYHNGALAPSMSVMNSLLKHINVGKNMKLRSLLLFGILVTINNQTTSTPLTSQYSSKIYRDMFERIF